MFLAESDYGLVIVSGFQLAPDVNATQHIVYPFPVYYHCGFRGSVRISRTSFKIDLKLVQDILTLPLKPQ